MSVWINACSHEKFTSENITRNTCICALHWPGEKSPTPEHPDPLKTNLTPKQIAKASAPKRKALFRPKADVPFKEEKDTHQDAAEETGETFSELGSKRDIGYQLPIDPLYPDEKPPVQYKCASTGRLVSDECTQTECYKYLLSAKVDTMVLKNEVAKMKSELNVSVPPKVVSNSSYKVISQDSTLMKHFLGLTSEQFKALHNFLDSICPLDKITFWNCKESNEQTDNKCGQEPKCSTEEMLFICILRLRRAYTIKTLAVLLSTPDRTNNQ